MLGTSTEGIIAERTAPEIAHQGVEMVGTLYAVEKQAAAFSAEKKLQMRQARSVPLLAEGWANQRKCTRRRKGTRAGNADQRRRRVLPLTGPGLGSRQWNWRPRRRCGSRRQHLRCDQGGHLYAKGL